MSVPTVATAPTPSSGNPYVMAGIQGASGLFGGLFNIGARKRQFKYQQKLMDKQYSKDLEMWHLANKYNSPAEQMARLKEAGLNPNLMYKQGTTGSTQTSIPKYQSASAPFLGFENASNAFNVLNQYQDFQIRKQQLKNLENVTLLNDQKFWSEVSRSSGLSLNTEYLARTLDQRVLREKYNSDLQFYQSQFRKKDFENYWLNLGLKSIAPLTGGLKGFMNLWSGKGKGKSSHSTKTVDVNYNYPQ